MSSSPRHLIPTLSGLGLALVACADIGAIHGLPPWAATAPALGAGLALGALAAPGPVDARARWAGLVVIATAAVWLPALDGAARVLSSTAGWAGAGPTAALLLGALGGRFARRRGLWALPDPITLLVAAVAAMPLLMGVVTRVGVVAAGVLGGVLWGLALVLRGAPEAARSADGGRLDGLPAGVLAGAIAPGLLLWVGPIVGPTVGMVARAGAAVAAGLAIASLLAGTRARALRFLGPAAGFAGLHLAAAAPALLLATSTSLPVGPDDAAWVCGALLVAALLVPAALTTPVGPGTPPGLALGLAAWWWLPGPAAAILAGSVAWSLALLPDVRALRSPAARAAAALAVAVGAGSPLLPLPDDGLRAFAPLALGPDGSRFEDVVERFSRASAETVGGPAGQVLLYEEEDGTRRLWRDGRSLRLDERVREPDRFLGYLPALVGPTPERWLVLGDGIGAVTDAVRRIGPVVVTAFPGHAGARLAGARLSDWNRDLRVDPAVRVVDVDPLLAGGAEYDAVIVDLPPLWAFGAGHATSDGRLERVAESLTPGGVAVFRIPLATLSAEELRRLAGRFAGRFGALTAWLDPAGSDHLLLVGTREDAKPDAGAPYRLWERPRVRSDLRLAALDEPAAVLDRAIADRPALLLLGADVPRRDAAGVAALAGRRLERGARTLALSALSAAASDPRTLFDLSGVPPDAREALDERLARAADVRESYLEMLGHIAAGDPAAAMTASRSLAEGGGSASDMRVLTEPFLRRGDALMAKGRVEAAHAEYLLAYSFAGTDVEANRKLADSYRLQNKVDDAIRHYGAALELDPTSLEASLGLADAHAREGKPERAAAALRDVQEAHPGSYVLLVNLAHFESEIASTGTDDARDHGARARVLLQRAAALEPGRPEARAGLARVYYLEQEYDRALEEIDRAITLRTSCIYQTWRGLIQYEKGALDGAAGDLKAALLTCPEHHEARNTLGAVYAAQSKREQAEATWRDVLARDPGNEAATRNLATLEATILLTPP